MLLDKEQAALKIVVKMSVNEMVLIYFSSEKDPSSNIIHPSLTITSLNIADRSVDVGVLLALLSSSALEMLYCCECFAAVLLAIMV